MGWKAGQPNDSIGKYRETKNTNGVEILEFLATDKMKILNDRVKQPHPQRTRQWMQEGESSTLD